MQTEDQERSQALCINQLGRKEETMSEYVNVAEIFGQDVFNDSVMQERLPKRCIKS